MPELSAPVSANATTIQLSTMPDDIKVGNIVIIEPHTPACEFCRVVHFSSSTITLAYGVREAHSMGASCLVLNMDHMDVAYLNLVYGKDASPAQASENTRVFSDAIDAAIANDAILKLPAEVIRFETETPADTRFFTVSVKNQNASLRIRGEGRNSVLYFPLLYDKTDVFYCNKDICVDFRDFDVHGPETLSAPLREGTYTIAAGSKNLQWVSGQNFTTLTKSGATENILKRFIYIQGAGPGQTPFRSFVKGITSSTQVELEDAAVENATAQPAHWYGNWQFFYSNNKVFNFLGAFFEKLGNGRSIRVYPGQRQIEAFGFTFKQQLANGYIHIYVAEWGKAVRYKVKLVSDDGLSAQLYLPFDDRLKAYTYTADTASSYYQHYQSLTFNNVHTLGHFRNVFSWDDGCGEANISFCDWSCMETVIGSEPDFSQIDMTEMQINLFKTRIHDSGTTLYGDGNMHPANPNGRLCYFGEGTGLNILECEFDGNYRTGLSVYGGGNNNLSPYDYRPVTVANCYFGKRLSRALQTGALQNYTIINCEIKSQLHIMGNASITNTNIDIDYGDRNSGLSEGYIACAILLEHPNEGNFSVTMYNGSVRCENSLVPLIRNFNVPSNINTQHKRIARFHGTSFFLNESTLLTVALDPDEAPFFLGHNFEYEFESCLISVSAYQQLKGAGIMRFQQAKSVYVRNCNFYFRNAYPAPNVPSPASQRAFNFTDQPGTTSTGNNFLKFVHLENVQAKYLNTSGIYAESTTFAELFYVNSLTEINVINCRPGVVTPNSTSEALLNNGDNVFKLDRNVNRIKNASMGSAAIINGYTNPVTLLPAPGSNKFIVLKSISVKRAGGSTQYSGNVLLDIKCGSAVLSTIDLSSLPAGVRIYGIASVDCAVNTALTAQAQTGNPSGGNIDIALRLQYDII